MKLLEFRLKLHWSLFLRAQWTILQHWFRKWLGADQATSHYLNQWWLDYRRIYASLGLNELTHWSRVMHICVSKFTIIGSDNGLSPGQHQAVIWTSAAILSIRPEGTYFSEILFKIKKFSFKKIYSKWQPFCLCLNVLTHLPLWWAPSAKGKDHHGVSSGWSSVWHRSNTGLSSTQYEQIPIILGVWPFWLTTFFFRSITFWRGYG